MTTTGQLGTPASLLGLIVLGAAQATTDVGHRVGRKRPAQPKQPVDKRAAILLGA